VILRPSSATGLAKPARRKSLTREDAEALALVALEFLGQDGERIGRFLSLSGLDPGSLRKAVAEPGFLPAVLDYVAGDEILLVAFAEATGIAPERIGEARRLLSPEADFG
jgi:chromosome segregation ATPase